MLHAWDGSPCGARVQGGAWGWVIDGGTVWILEDITAAERSSSKGLETEHDALTQLFNRAAFDERLGALLAERATRLRDNGAAPHAAAGECVVLFMDLDHFTVVNDLAGA